MERCPGTHDVDRASAIDPIQRAPDRFSIESHPLLGKIRQRAHPRHKGLLKRDRLEYSPDPAKRIVRRNALGEVQKR
jgi:hypothetical protein